MVIDGVAGHVELAHFAGLERVLADRIPVDRHTGSTDPSTARRVLLSGALMVTAGAGLYAANTGLAAVRGWDRFLVPIPIVVAAIGLLTVRAGLRVRFGRGPLTSALYNPGYPPVVIRFVLTAIVSNFILVALWNEFVPSR